MFYGTDSILQNIPHTQIEYKDHSRIFYKILSVPQNIVKDMSNVME
jgi:hypothetical protein